VEAVVLCAAGHHDAEAALRESEGLLRATLESTADGILVVGADGRVIHANGRFAQMWGVPEPLLRGGDDEKLLQHVLSQLGEPEEFLARVQALYQSDEEGLETIHFRDGRVFERFTRPLMREGRVAGRVWSFRDITARHRAEERLRLDEARLEALVRLSEMADAPLRAITDFAMESGVKLTRSTMGYLAFTNEDESVLTMHSWSKTAMAECAIEDKPVVYPVETTGLWGEAVRQRRPIITNDYGAPNPAKRGYPEGHVRVTRHLNIPVFDGDRIVAVAGVGNKSTDYDETDVIQLRLLMDGMWRLIHRRRAEEALRQARDDLERRVEERTRELARSNAELERFASVASHDLQEPLRKVVAFGDRLAEACGSALDESGRDYLDRMQNAARRMQGLISDLLAYSRVISRAQPFGPVNLADVAREVVEDLETRIEMAGGRVEVGPLPIIDADRTQMRQLLQNLIANGLKFHRPDLAPVVRVWGELADGVVLSPQRGPERVCRIEVSDNGIGFDPKYADRIFGVFQRLHGQSEYEGTGIGLAICRRIAERHGGQIEVESAPECGARFTVTIPACQPEEGDTP